jgi:hypothetical protein
MRINNIRWVGGVLRASLVMGSLVLVCGCGGGVSERRGVKEMKGGQWKLKSRAVQSNTYTKDGLLDSSCTTDYFLGGGRMDTVKSVTERQYERGRLVHEMDFTIVGKDGKRELADETIRKYDAKGNKIAETQKMMGKTVIQFYCQYNDKGQLLQRLLLFTPTGSHDVPDSGLSVFIYDAEGHQVSAILSDTKEQGRKVKMTLYKKNGEKDVDFLIGPDGDTLEKRRYELDGDLMKEVSLLRTPNGSDTVWYRKDKIVKVIRHSEERRKREKTIYEYDAHGNETASFSYEAPL